MEEVPLQFIDTWNIWGKYTAIAIILLAIIKISLYFIKMKGIKDLKVRYDFICKKEIKQLWSSTIILLLGMGVLFNSFISEIGIFWFMIRVFVTLVGGFLIGIIINNILKFYYPFSLEKRLKKIRYTPRISPKTKRPMKLMSESEEDVYLDEGMQAEEDVFSVDYDVWLDEETGFTKIEKYSGYLLANKCPECGYQTLKLLKEDIIEKPTLSSSGRLVKHYECNFCDHMSQSTHKVGRLSI